MNLMGLGPFRFSMNTVPFNELSRNLDVRAESQMVIMSRPSIHYLGPGDEEITIDGTLYPHFISGKGLMQIEGMYAAAAAGTPLMMASGGGRIFGRWVIRNISSVDKHLLRDGTPMRLDFSMTVVRAGAAFGGLRLF